MIKRADWLAVAKDRAAMLLFFVLLVLTVSMIVTAVLRTQSSDIQVPVRYTTYGQNNIYRDQWFTQYVYIGFGLLVALVNGFLAVKAYQVSRILGLGLLGLTIFVMIFALVVMNAVFNLTPVV